MFRGRSSASPVIFGGRFVLKQDTQTLLGSRALSLVINRSNNFPLTKHKNTNDIPSTYEQNNVQNSGQNNKQTKPNEQNKAKGGKIKDLKRFPRSKSEAAVIKLLEEITGAKFPTVLPDWLKRGDKLLELDGYNESLKIALEFSGPQHTKWNSSEETYDKYFNRINNDAAKKILCADNGVSLIVIDMSLPKQHWRNYLLSRLRDINPDKYDIPDSNYIREQTASVFRDEQLEKSLNLHADFDLPRD